MFTPHPRSNSIFFGLILMCIAISTSFQASAGVCNHSRVVDQFIEVYNEGLTVLTAALADAPLTSRERGWVLRQHRILKMRAEIQLERILCPADIELLRQDIRSLVESIESMKNQYVFAQKAQRDVHP